MGITEDGLTALLDSNQPHIAKVKLTLEFLSATNNHHFALNLATRCHAGHGKDPRSVLAVTLLRQYLNGTATLSELQEAAANAWQAVRDNEVSDPEKAYVGYVCACAASFADPQASFAHSSLDGLPEQANQVADLKTLVNGGSLP